MYKVKRFSIYKNLIINDNKVEFTHATRRKDVNSILKDGLLGSKSHRKDSITNMSRNITGSNLDLVYLSNDGRSSNLIKNVCDKYLGGGSILHIDIPYNEFKKMKIVDNPELLGSKSYDEFIDLYKNKYKKTIKMSDIPSTEYYDMMKNGTTVINGNVPPEYIRESDKYKFK